CTRSSFFFQAEDGIRGRNVTGVQTCALPILPAREAEIIRRRFGWNGEPPQTLDAIGDRFAVTRERIRQLEKKSLEKLKEKFEAHSFFAEVSFPAPKSSTTATLTSHSTLQTGAEDPQPAECDK